MRPADWYAAGVRLLGRTAVECTRDELADAIASDIAAVEDTAPDASPVLVVDLFVGSANTLYWILRRLRGARGVGFELDETVCRLTSENLRVLSSPIEVINVDYVAGLESASVPSDQTIVAFVAPPWGHAFDAISGLDPRRTSPPIPRILDVLFERFAAERLLVAIQIHERVDATSLAELEARFDWSALRVYGLNAAGENHGILLGTRGWMPGGAEPIRGENAQT
jgi:hypothetical protein